MNKTPTTLIIMDGFGLSDEVKGCLLYTSAALSGFLLSPTFPRRSG